MNPSQCDGYDDVELKCRADTDTDNLGQLQFRPRWKRRLFGKGQGQEREREKGSAVANGRNNVSRGLLRGWIGYDGYDMGMDDGTMETFKYCK